MSRFEFRKATKMQAKLRMALTGPPNAGKTWTALALATHLGFGRIALIDTERGSASKYADIFDFDAVELTSFHPQNYIDAIKAAEQGGYGVVVIDSLSHAWVGKDGALEIHDAAVARQRNPNKYTAWGEVTPIQNALIESITGCAIHVIATMRSRMEYVQEGKTVRKVGMAPVQRDGVEYEFDIVGDLDIDNRMAISKTRCSELHGKLFHKPGKEVADVLRAWLTTGAEPPAAAPAPPPAPPKPANGHPPKLNGVVDLLKRLGWKNEYTVSVLRSRYEADRLGVLNVAQIDDFAAYLEDQLKAKDSPPVERIGADQLDELDQAAAEGELSEDQLRQVTDRFQVKTLAELPDLHYRPALAMIRDMAGTPVS